MSDFKQLRRWAEDWLGFAWIISVVVLTGILVPGNLAQCQETGSISAEEEKEQSETSRVDQINNDSNSSVPKLPHAVTKLPEWVGEGVPFDVERYFAAPPASQNAATRYLDALLEFDDWMEMCFVDDPNTWVLAPEYATRLAVTKVRWLWAIWVIDRFRDDPESVDPEELDYLLGEFEEGFRKLRDAQRQPDCVFEVGFGPSAFMPHRSAAGHVSHVVRLRVYRQLVSGNLDAVLDDVEMLLRLARDLRPRGDFMCQLVSLNLQQKCWQELLPRIISHEGIQVEHCDRLMKLIAPHDQEIDPCLENERYQQLMWRKLLYQLERNEYDVAARVRDFDLRGTFTVPSMLLWELCSSGDYRINPDVVRRFAEQTTGQDDDAKKLFEKLKQQEDGNKRLTAKANKMLAMVMLTQAVMNMSADDYRQEYSVLDQRYRQMEKAVGMPFPKRAEHMAMLQSWTADDAWEQTNILRLFEPHLMHPEQVRLVTVRRRLAMCLVAVARGRLAGANEPADLAAMVRAAGFPNVPVDPYSGVPLRMTEVNGQPIFYSVGPDGDDDQARANFVGWGWPFENPPDGDICLRWLTSAKDED
jgi:hypothetical protein